MSIVTINKSEVDKITISNLVKTNTILESKIRNDRKILIECRRVLKVVNSHFTNSDETFERYEKLLKKLNKL